MEVPIPEHARPGGGETRIDRSAALLLAVMARRTPSAPDSLIGLRKVSASRVVIVDETSSASLRTSPPELRLVAEEVFKRLASDIE